ncbi:MAG: hypothetical protein KGO02_26020 [Alphaproteobacteria bacterium]|nr:hypothetical protein [Alphaproteobacteria bacterium]
MISATADFDWSDDECVILKEQMAVAVYPNSRGDVVIRQEHGWDEDSDRLILIQPCNAKAVADALLAAAADWDDPPCAHSKAGPIGDEGEKAVALPLLERTTNG